MIRTRISTSQMDVVFQCLRKIYVSDISSFAAALLAPFKGAAGPIRSTVSKYNRRGVWLSRVIQYLFGLWIHLYFIALWIFEEMMAALKRRWTEVKDNKVQVTLQGTPIKHRHSEVNKMDQHREKGLSLKIVDFLNSSSLDYDFKFRDSFWTSDGICNWIWP